MSLLQQFDLFRDLPSVDRQALAAHMVVRSSPPGHVFVREGGRPGPSSGALFLILSGDVEVVSSATAGGFGVHRVLGPGALFGLVALLDDAPRSATCRGLGPVQTASLTRAALGALAHENLPTYARFQMCVARQLAADLRRLSDALTDATALREAQSTGS